MNYLQIIIGVQIIIIFYLGKNWLLCLVKIKQIQKYLDELEKELKEQGVI